MIKSNTTTTTRSFGSQLQAPVNVYDLMNKSKMTTGSSSNNNNSSSSCIEEEEEEEETTAAALSSSSQDLKHETHLKTCLFDSLQLDNYQLQFKLQELTLEIEFYQNLIVQLEDVLIVHAHKKELEAFEDESILQNDIRQQQKVLYDKIYSILNA